MAFIETIETVGKVIDGAGVAIIAIGAVVAAGIAIGHVIRKSTGTYRLFREQLGRTILLGLEVLIIADIVLTVAIDQTFESAVTLAIIVLVRTFLSFSLEIELDGVVPWRRKAATLAAAQAGIGTGPMATEG